MEIIEFIQKLGLKVHDSYIDIADVDIDVNKLTPFGTSGFRIKGATIENNEIKFDRSAILQEFSYVDAACKITTKYCDEIGAHRGILICGDGLRPHQKEFLDIYAAIVSANGLTPYVQVGNESITSVGAAHDALSFEEITTVIYRSCSHNPPHYLGAKMYLNNDPSPVLGTDGKMLFDHMKEILLNKKNITIDLNFKEKISYINAIEYHIDQTMKMIDIAMPDLKKTAPKNEKIVVALNGGHKEEIEMLFSLIGIPKKNITFIEEKELILNSDPTSKDPKKIDKYFKICREKNAKILIATDSDQDRPILYIMKENKLVQLTSNEILNLAMIEIGRNNKNLIPVHTHPTLNAYQQFLPNPPYISGVGFLFISILFKKLLGVECDQSRKDEAIILDHKFRQLSFDNVSEMRKHQFSIAIEESGGAQLVSKTLKFNSYDKNGLFTLSMIFYAIGKIGIENVIQAAFDLSKFSDRDSIELKEVSHGQMLVNFLSERSEFLGLKVTSIKNSANLPICSVLQSKDVVIQVRPSGTEPIVRVYYMGTRKIVEEYLQSKEIVNGLLEIVSRF